VVGWGQCGVEGEASVGFIKIKIPPSRIDEMGE